MTNSIGRRLAAERPLAATLRMDRRSPSYATGVTMQ
jgi:hypothetical protein